MLQRYFSKEAVIRKAGFFAPIPNQNRFCAETGDKQGLVKTIVPIHKLDTTLEVVFLEKGRRNS